MSPIEKLASSSFFSSSSSALELDPLLKDLTEKRLIFKKNVTSMAAELKDVRSRLALQEESVIRESESRKVAEMKAKKLEEEVGLLQMRLEEKDTQLKTTNSNTKQYLKELDDLKSQLFLTQASAKASAASAESAQSQCLNLLKELDEKSISLKENESRVNKLVEQLDHLQNDLEARDLSQRQLKEEVLRMEKEFKQVVTVAAINRDCELMKIQEEVSPKITEKMNKLLDAKNEDIVRLRDEIRFLSAHWRHKTKELESQLEKHHRADQELKKKVLKLEFCLQEARSQLRKLQRVEERRNKQLKELKDQMSVKQNNVGKENFWESSGFKVIMSMSMLVLVALSRR